MLTLLSQYGATGSTIFVQHSRGEGYSNTQFLQLQDKPAAERDGTRSPGFGGTAL